MKRLGTIAVFAVILLTLAACQQVDGGLIVRTADPALSIFVPVPAPDVVVPAEEVGETEQEPPSAPPAEIKGNISRSGEKIYHVPGQANYDSVKISEEDGERWFVTEEEAEAAGWRKARN